MKVPKFYSRRESKISVFVKNYLFWGGLVSMLIISSLLLTKNDIKIPQRETVVKLDIKDKVNICLPDDKFK